MSFDKCPTNDSPQSHDDSPAPTLIKRRGFVGLCALSAAAIISGTEKAHAGLFYSTKPVKGIPDDWVKKKGMDVLRYANYIKSLKLKNITPAMVLQPHFKKRGTTSNTLPPKYMWKRLGYTLKVIDLWSSELGSPVKELLSIYRSPVYNRLCGGKSRSLHMQNQACDVKFSNVSAYTAARRLKAIRDRGVFKGGIGTYNSFVHIDTRGSNATW